MVNKSKKRKFSKKKKTKKIHYKAVYNDVIIAIYSIYFTTTITAKTGDVY